MKVYSLHLASKVVRPFGEAQRSILSPWQANGILGALHGTTPVGAVWTQDRCESRSLQAANTHRPACGRSTPSQVLHDNPDGLSSRQLGRGHATFQAASYRWPRQ